MAFKSLSSILIKDLTSMSLASWLFCTNNRLMKKVLSYIDLEESQGNAVDFLEAFLTLRKEYKDIDDILSFIKDLKNKIKDSGFKPEVIENVIPNKLNKPHEAKLFIDKVWSDTLELASNNSSSDGLNNGVKFLNLLSEHIDKIKKPEIGKIHVTTYRKSKGLEAGLVIVTSVDDINFPKKDGNCRLLYVSATRAKRNLVLTYSNKASGARRYSIGRSSYFSGVPKTIRSLIIPKTFATTPYSDKWLNQWTPV